MALLPEDHVPSPRRDFPPTREWRQTQKRLADQIAEYENASHDYVHDGVRLLELAKKAYFLFKQQTPSEKRKLLNFVCSNSVWKDQTLTATFRQPFDLLAVTNTTWQKEKAAVVDSSDLRHIVVAHTGHSSQLFPSRPAEMLSFLQQLRASTIQSIT